MSRTEQRRKTSADQFRGKKIRVARNGDPYDVGIRVSVNSKRFPNFETFLDHLSSKIPLPNGVQRLYTMSGQKISSLDGLEEAGQYVAATSMFTPVAYFGQPPHVRPRSASPSKATKNDKASKVTLILQPHL